MPTILELMSQLDWRDQKVKDLKEFFDGVSKDLELFNPEADLQDVHECLNSLIGEHVTAKTAEKKASGKKKKEQEPEEEETEAEKSGKKGRKMRYSQAALKIIKKEVNEGRCSAKRLQGLIKKKFNEDVKYQAIWKYVNELRSEAPEKKEDALVIRQGRKQILSDIDGELKATKALKNVSVRADDDFEGMPDIPESDDNKEEEDD